MKKSLFFMIFLSVSMAHAEQNENIATQDNAQALSEALVELKDSADTLADATKKMTIATIIVLHQWGKGVEIKTIRALKNAEIFFRQTGRLLKTLSKRTQRAYQAFTNYEATDTN